MKRKPTRTQTELNADAPKQRNIKPDILLGWRQITFLLSTMMLACALASNVNAAPLEQTEEAEMWIADLKTSDPVFDDDFTTFDEQWSLGSDGGMSNHNDLQEAVMVQGLGDSIGWINHAELDAMDHSDYYVEAEIIQADVDGDSYFYGVNFRQEDDANFYFFGVFVDGESDQAQYGLVSVEDGTERELIGLTETDLFEPNGVQLGVAVFGPDIAVLINDSVVATVEDDAHPSGSIGLAGGTNGNEIPVSFDRVTLWATSTPDSDTTPDAQEDEDVDAGDEADTDSALGAAITRSSTDGPDEDATPAQLDDIRAVESDFYDEFRRDDGTWLGDPRAEVVVDYQNRMRTITVGPDTMTWDLHIELLELAPTDYLVEVDTAFQDGDVTAEYGIVFRYVDQENFYVFGIIDDVYSLWLQADGEWQPLIEQVASDAIDPGGENRLGVLAQGASLTLVINDVAVDSVRDDISSGGGVGLFIETPEQDGAEVAFDNFDLWLVDAPVEPESDAAIAQEADAEEEPASATGPDADVIDANVAALRSDESDYFEGFRRDEGNWSVGSDADSTIAIEGRMLVIEVDAPGVLILSNYTPEPELASPDYYVEVTAEQVDGGSDGSHGLVFRVQDNRNFYFFDLYQGAFGLRKLQDGEWMTVIDLTEYDGEPERLGVWAAGPAIALLIDQRVVATVWDDTYLTGGIGLAAGTFDAETYTAAFDDLELWAIPEEMLTEQMSETPVRTDAEDAGDADAEGDVDAAIEEDTDADTTGMQDDVAGTFTIDAPPGWDVMMENGILTARSTENRALLLIMALYAEQPLTADIVDQIQALWIETLPMEGVEWSEPVDWGASGRRATGISDDQYIVNGNTWTNSEQGSALFMYTAGAPDAETLATLAPDLEQLITSARLLIPQMPVAPTDVAFVPWEEAEQNAFSILAPDGWDISGGVFNASEIDRRPWLTAMSPDEEIYIEIGEQTLSTFIVPNEILEGQGYAQGDSFSIDGTEFVVWPYLPGEEFLSVYADLVLGLEGCTLEARALPELTEAVRSYVLEQGTDYYGTQQDAGELIYTCGSGEDAVTGYLAAVTAFTSFPDADFWEVISLIGVESTSDRVDEARAILARMAGTFSLSDSWINELDVISAEEAAQISEYAGGIARLVGSAVGPLTAAEPASEATIDTDAMELGFRIGETDAADAIVLFNDPQFTWLDAQGNILGTDVRATSDDVDIDALVNSEIE